MTARFQNRFAERRQSHDRRHRDPRCRRNGRVHRVPPRPAARGKVVVIDKGHVAQGGSGRSSALVRMHYSYPPEVQLALLSLRMFENWRDIVGQEGDFRKTGFVRIVHPGETERLKQNVEMQRELGVNVKLIDRVELKALEPDWAVDEVELAAYEPDSGYGDGAGVANDFLTRARELGVTYQSKTQALELLRRRWTHARSQHRSRRDCGAGRGLGHRTLDPAAVSAHRNRTAD